MAKNFVAHLTHPQRVKILYKTILKLHRGLPTELKDLGDKYIKDEFKRHKTCSPIEANMFMTEWANYALGLSEQLGLRGKPKDKIGKALDPDSIEKLQDDQAVQLFELMNAAKGIDENDNNNRDSRSKLT